MNLYKLVIKWKKDYPTEIFLFEEDLVDELSEKFLGSFYEGQEIELKKAYVYIFSTTQPGDEDNYPWLDWKKMKRLFEYLSE